MLKALKGYRTIAFNVVMGVTMILTATGVIAPEEVPGEDVLNAFLDNLEVVIGGVTTVVNVFLRTITDTPVGKKEPVAPKETVQS